MARIRKFCAYRRLERPYTRISKFRKLNFIKARPNIKVAKYEMGDLRKKFEKTFELQAKTDLQIRHNALDSARMTCNRKLEETLGKGMYKFVIRIFPHHILRENPLAAGAGADRMSTGMKASFGKPIGTAARVKKGQAILEVKVSKEGVKTAKEALTKASKKLPCSCLVVEKK